MVSRLQDSCKLSSSVLQYSQTRLEGRTVQIPRLREWREARALTQVELAEKASVSSRSVAGYEAGTGARPPTVRKLAEALDIEILDLMGEATHPKASVSSQPSFNGLLEEERRVQDLGVWRSYLRRRVEWCEKVLQKSQEDSFNPFLSLDTAIQWAIYVGIESTQLQNALRTDVRSYTDADSEIVGELRALLDRFVAVDATTTVRVKAMMDEAGLTNEDKEQRLRLIHGSAA
jgi:transcriptional regulator with XRE-family HTH domain